MNPAPEPARELIRLGFRINRLKDWTRDPVMWREIEATVEDVITLANTLGQEACEQEEATA